MSLCSACAEHFNFSRPDIVARIKVIKERAVYDADSNPEDLSESQEDFLRRDLERYEQGVSNAQAVVPQQEVLWPTPWAEAKLSHGYMAFIKVWEGSKGPEIEHTYGQLESSKDCRMCIILLSMIQYASKTRGGQINASADVETTWMMSTGSCHPLQLNVRVLDAYLDCDDSLDFELKVTMDCSGTGLPRSLPRIPTGLSTEGPSCAEFLLGALSNCLRNHQLCASSQIDSWMPSRLLDIRLLPYRDPNFIQLVERDDIHRADGAGKGSRLRYYTLSHVWGNSRPAQLTQANYTGRKKGISLHELPRCFRYAVKVTRDLGGGYLWMDALCIIQDSAEDWASEAASMDQVYVNGVCNIAACDIQDSNDSLFSTRDPQNAAIVENRKFIRGDSTEDLVFTLVPDWSRLILESCRLYSRAWVIQERWLSRRIIHFSQFPVWQCRVLLATEGLPPFEETVGPSACEVTSFDPLDDQDKVGEQDRHRLFYPPNFDVQPNIIDKERFYMDWWETILHSYGKASLTYRTDKLVAIGGVAKAFRPLFGKENGYYAGIWGGKHLLRGLLWITPDPPHYNPLDEDDVYIAPSWSWASVDGEFRSSFARENPDPYHDLVELVSCTIIPKHGDVFGQLSSAELVLRGTLFRIRKGANLTSIYKDRKNIGSGSSQLYFLPLIHHDLIVGGEDICAIFRGLALHLADELPGEQPRYKRFGVFPDLCRWPGMHDEMLDYEQWSILDNLYKNVGDGQGELITII